MNFGLCSTVIQIRTRRKFEFKGEILETQPTKCYSVACQTLIKGESSQSQIPFRGAFLAVLDQAVNLDLPTGRTQPCRQCWDIAGSDCRHRVLQGQEQKCLMSTRKAERPEKGFSPVTLMKSLFVLYETQGASVLTVCAAGHHV